MWVSPSHISAATIGTKYVVIIIIVGIAIGMELSIGYIFCFNNVFFIGHNIFLLMQWCPFNSYYYNLKVKLQSKLKHYNLKIISSFHLQTIN
jgi:hypothetical protein